MTEQEIGYPKKMRIIDTDEKNYVLNIVMGKELFGHLEISSNL